MLYVAKTVLNLRSQPIVLFPRGHVGGIDQQLENKVNSVTDPFCFQLNLLLKPFCFYLLTCNHLLRSSKVFSKFSYKLKCFGNYDIPPLSNNSLIRRALFDSHGHSYQLKKIYFNILILFYLLINIHGHSKESSYWRNQVLEDILDYIILLFK